MIKLTSSLLLGLLLLASCSRDNTSQYETNPVAEQVVDAPSVVSFSSFAEELPVLSLPFTASCSFDYAVGARLDTTVAGSFLRSHEVPYRRFSVSKEVTALLVLFPTDQTLPRIRTYNQAGVILDEQDLKFKPCGEEPGFEHTEQYTIQKDFTIVHVDSTTRWQVDAQYNEVPNTRKATVTRTRFKIRPTGEISEVK
ncbi:hypothetical protein [Rufibacter psychrotolerans]|uniref:hypothetical protein n=1 Tax=Rufibacter psychrotolerans TaxID=2812556 RepID=UPI0019674FF5|nr:hypothetical protein [Rufibacter sp. SYSU D00308]